MNRHHLVLVHSFPTNSILLKGLIEFLEQYVTVHFVDLPGFIRHQPPLPRVSLDAFAEFLERRICELDLDEYILGGVSFGFLVVTATRVDGRCKGILAMEPFLGAKSLHMSRSGRFLFTTLVRTIARLGLSQRAWKSGLFRRRLLGRGPVERVETVLREIDPRTFFETAHLIMTHTAELRPHDLPHVLLINPGDRTIDVQRVVDRFTDRVQDLLVVETTVDHYPTELTKEYFHERISQQQIESLLAFVGWQL